MRRGNWKSVGRGNPDDLNNWELYDLERDRTESTDLAKENPEALKQMIDAWRRWLERMDS